MRVSVCGTGRERIQDSSPIWLGGEVSDFGKSERWQAYVNALS
ncbi:hypothetical protein B0G57_112151 [Trinickia symbiotica]|nr:hypothetical protein B0G57_112151 [Trinickia symbiotica]